MATVSLESHRHRKLSSPQLRVEEEGICEADSNQHWNAKMWLTPWNSTMWLTSLSSALQFVFKLAFGWRDGRSFDRVFGRVARLYLLLLFRRQYPFKATIFVVSRLRFVGPISIYGRAYMANKITIPDGFTLHTENNSHILLSSNEAFLNPVQEFNRDTSVACIRVWSEQLHNSKKEKWQLAQEKGTKKKKNKRPKRELPIFFHSLHKLFSVEADVSAGTSKVPEVPVSTEPAVVAGSVDLVCF